MCGVTGWSRVRILIWEGNFSPKYSDRRWGPRILLFNGYRGSFPGLKRAGREVHSPAFSAGVKNEWSYTSVPSVHLHGVDRHNFTNMLFVL